jgi:hypothetical protein
MAKNIVKKEENILKSKEEFFKDKEKNIQNTIAYLQHKKENDVNNPFKK